jgi:hypothetical protein
MRNYFEIPTRPGIPFKERVTLQNVTYSFSFKWNTVSLAWVLDVYDETGVIPIVSGIPIVTGADLLEQFPYLDFGAHAVLMALTIAVGASPDEVPTFENLGVDGHLYYVTP